MTTRPIFAASGVPDNPHKATRGQEPAHAVSHDSDPFFGQAPQEFHEFPPMLHDPAAGGFIVVDIDRVTAAVQELRQAPHDDAAVQQPVHEHDRRQLRVPRQMFEPAAADRVCRKREQHVSRSNPGNRTPAHSPASRLRTASRSSSPSPCRHSSVRRSRLRCRLRSSSADK